MAGSTSQVSLSCAYFMWCKNPKAITLHSSWEGKALLLTPSQQHRELHLLTKGSSHRSPAGMKAQEPRSWELPRAGRRWLHCCSDCKHATLGSPAPLPRASWALSTGILSLLGWHRSSARGSLAFLAGALLCDFTQNRVQPHQGVFSTHKNQCVGRRTWSKALFSLLLLIPKSPHGTFWCAAALAF